MVKKSKSKGSGVKLAGKGGKRGKGIFSNIGNSLLNSGKQLIKDNAGNIAGDLAKVGANMLVNKVLGNGYKVASVKVVRKK